jgi:hypothetical protein
MEVRKVEIGKHEIKVRVEKKKKSGGFQFLLEHGFLRMIF